MPARRSLSLLGGLVALGGLAWIVGRADLAQFWELARAADPRYLALLVSAILAEQLVRAWKWRHILDPLRSVATLRLFGAIMTGYFANLLVPLGVSPLVRAWLISRLEPLRMSALLASVAIDRLTDGVAFAALTIFVVGVAALPDPDGTMRLGLSLAAVGSLALIAAVLTLLWRHKRASAKGLGWVLRFADRRSEPWRGRLRSLALSFAEGIIWPAEPWRRLVIVAASLVIKLVAASHLLWAGLAFGVTLAPLSYLALLAIIGFAHVLAHVVRVPGGFILGAVFALDLFGVGEAQALAMVTAVALASMAVVAGVGALTLWRYGLGIGELAARARSEHERA